jgi:DNA invertase Pin-like site-specific DNA recombinase
MIGLTRKSRGDDEGTHTDQRLRIEERAAREGFTLVRVTKEHKVSGGLAWRTREIGKAIADVEAGKADGIMHAYEDRISREGLEAAVQIWRAMANANAVYIACDGVDSRVEGAEFTFNLKACVAAEQLRIYKVRSDAGRGRSVMKDGVHGGSIPPWGYDWTTRSKPGGKTAHGPLAPVKDNRVKEAFEAAAAAAAGVSHPKFRREFGVRMSNVIPSRVYLGEAKSGDFVNANHDGSLDSEGLGRTHPALVSEELFRRANARFQRAESGVGRPAKSKTPPAVLSGTVLRCGTCGHGMTRQLTPKVTPKGNNHHYRCQNNPYCDRRVSISCAAVEPFVLETALRWHAEDTGLRLADAGDFDLAALDVALDAARAEVAEVERMHAAGELSPVAYAGARTAADNAVAAAGMALSDGETASGWRSVPAARVAEKVTDDVEAQRSLIADFVRAHVMPFNGKRVPVSERVALSRVTHGLPGVAVETGNGTGAIIPLVAEEAA